MSSSQSNAGTPETSLTDEQVDAFLRAHPDFFERHVSLLAILKLPHPTGGAVSLIERQVSLLREKNRQLDRKLMDLVQVARENEHLSSRLHHLALGLMDADSLDAVLATVQEQLRGEFRADFAAIRVLGDPEHAGYFADPADPALASFEELFKNRRPACGRLPKQQLQFLFGEQAEEVTSAVAVPLAGESRLGILGLGAREPSRFHPGMGTLFLGYLGELISKAIAIHRGA